MTKKTMNDQAMVFFGTPEFAVYTLNALEEGGIVPDIIVTTPDKPAGRGLELKSSPVKKWALERDIPLLQPYSLKPTNDAQNQDIVRANEEAMDLLTNSEWDLFIVSAYGKILPKEILNLPRKGTLNVHPSLLPKFRGASPIESQILNDEKTVGVSIMLLDEELDHGPILAQASITPDDVPAKTEWPLPARALEQLLATTGGELLVEVISPWLDDTLKAEAQKHDRATFTQKIEKEDGEILLDDDGRKNYLKYLAYDVWPGVFFFVEKGSKKIRIKITEAKYENNTFIPIKVIPEGKKEILFTDFVVL